MSVLIDLRLSEARWNVTQYVNAKPTTITLTPTCGAPVSKPGGGHDFVPDLPRVPQIFRLDDTGGFDGIEYSPNDEGMSRKRALAILGPYDAILEIGDTWDEGTKGQDDYAHYHVDSLDPFNGYEVRGKVTAFVMESVHG